MSAYLDKDFVARNFHFRTRFEGYLTSQIIETKNGTIFTSLLTKLKVEILVFLLVQAIPCALLNGFSYKNYKGILMC